MGQENGEWINAVCGLVGVECVVECIVWFLIGSGLCLSAASSAPRLNELKGHGLNVVPRLTFFGSYDEVF
jgi:hypothetical protein